jgi:hypothetical protein
VTTLIYVHGTGVREAAYEESFGSIKKALKDWPDFSLARCYWGHLGARLNAGGVSIPTYGETRAIEIGVAAAPAGEIEVGLWALLALDPLFELTALSLRAEEQEEFVPGVTPPGLQLAQRGRSFRPSPEILAKLEEGDLGEAFSEAQDAITASDEYRDALGAAPAALAEYRAAIARAWVAESAIRSEERKGYPPAVWMDARLRDEIVDLLVDALGGREYGIGDWVRRHLGGLALQVGSHLGTRYARRRRGALTDAAYPFPSDILLYQARGHEIRAFVRECIRQAPPPVVLLAHSLGGIACVDLFVEEPMDIELLVTVGSQSPFLYEIGALQSLPFDSPLPKQFPRWLNIYDRRDLLSYVGAGVFHGRVRDVEVDNRQPFPSAHGAYWRNPAVWKAIFQELE